MQIDLAIIDIFFTDTAFLLLLDHQSIVNMHQFI